MINVDDRFLEEADESELFLMMHVAKHVNKNGFCWPSNKKLLSATKWDIKKLQRVKVRCIQKGFMKAGVRHNEFGAQSSNFYEVTTDYLSVLVSLNGKQMEEETHAPKRDTPLSQNGIAPLSQNGTTPHPQNGIAPLSQNGTTEVLINRSINKGSINNGTFIDSDESNGAQANPKKENLQGQMMTAWEKVYIEKVGEQPKAKRTKNEFVAVAEFAKHVREDLARKGKPNADADVLTRWVSFCQKAWDLNNEVIQSNFTPGTLWGMYDRINAALAAKRAKPGSKTPNGFLPMVDRESIKGKGGLVKPNFNTSKNVEL